MDKAETGPYVILHGDAWYVDDFRLGPSVMGARHHVCDGSEMLAVAYSYDPETGYCMHKHGSEKSVTRWADKSRAKFIDSGLDSMAAALHVIIFPLMPETVELLNGISRNGSRVSTLQADLQRLSAAIDDNRPASARPERRHSTFWRKPRPPRNPVHLSSRH